MTTIQQLLSSISESHIRDAQFLLAEQLNQPVTFLHMQAQTVLSDEQCQTFKAQLTQLEQGKPLAYILGNQPFWTLDFLVNEHTLIPRPDTEHLVEQALMLGDDLIKHTNKPLHVLDLGTGSGAIGICVKHERPMWQVTATDISSDALAVAKKNAALNQADVKFTQGSWFAAIANDKKYHLILSNPPYIAPDDEHLKQLTAEPITALVAQKNGMADIETIILGAKPHLYEGGWLLIEHGYNQATLVQQCFLAHKFVKIDTIKDFGGNDRITKAKLAKES